MSRRKEAHSREIEREGRSSVVARRSIDQQGKEIGGETSFRSVPAVDPASLLNDPKLVHPANASLRAQAVTELQQERGNALAQRLIQAGMIQPKLTIGAPGDECEREAERVARQISRAPESKVQSQEEEELQAKPLRTLAAPPIQRQEEEEEELLAKPRAEHPGSLIQAQEEEEEEEEELLQMRPEDGGRHELGQDLEARIERVRRGGEPLDDSTRTFFEAALGREFDGVRTHTDGAAAETAEALRARAFTVGQDIVFGAGEYHRGTASTTELLAHELTHVVQQTDPAAPARRSPANQQGQADTGPTSEWKRGTGPGSAPAVQCWQWPWSAPEGSRIVSVPEPEEETGHSPEIVSEPGEPSYQPVSEEDWLALRQECYDTMHDAERLMAFLEERGGDDARADRLLEISQSANRIYWAMRRQESPFRASALEQHRQRYEEIAAAYEGICHAVLREIGGTSGPAAEEEVEEERPRQLSSEQLDQIRQIIQGMDYGTVSGAYENMDRWLGNQPGLSHIKMAWDGTKATVDSIVTATDMPANRFTRSFALFGKVISAKGHIDAFRNIVCARDVAEAREARAYFDRFIQGWHRNGWAEVTTRYDAFGSGQYGAISVGESEFMAMPSEQQARLGVQIGQGAYGIEQRTMLSAAGAQILGALGDVTTALWHVAEFIAGRLFPIYGALDFGTDVIQEIAEALSGD